MALETAFIFTHFAIEFLSVNGNGPGPPSSREAHPNVVCDLCLHFSFYPSRLICHTTGGAGLAT